MLVAPERFFKPPDLLITSQVQMFEMYQSREEAIQALLDPASEPNQFEPGARQKRETKDTKSQEASKEKAADEE